MPNEITYFNTFIGQRLTGIPYSTQWMVHIDGLPDIVSNNLRDIDTQTWNIDRTGNGLRQTGDASNNAVDGNIFAQGVTTPGEKLDYHRVGMDSDFRGGFMQTPIIKSRNDNELLTIDFLETRDSFVDLVIRPWIIQVGYRGLIPSKDPKQNLKTDLWAIFFDRGDASKPDTKPIIRKKWIFHNAVPVACDSASFDYQKNLITTVKTQWLYTNYTIEAANDAPVTQKPSSQVPKFGGFTSPTPTFASTPGAFSSTQTSFNTPTSFSAPTG